MKNLLIKAVFLLLIIPSLSFSESKDVSRTERVRIAKTIVAEINIEPLHTAQRVLADNSDRANNKVVRDHRPPQPPNTATSTQAHRTKSPSNADEAIGPSNREQEVQSAQNEVKRYMEWIIGANKTGVVDAVVKVRAGRESYYNLKGLKKRKFLQYERQGTGNGINIGWTDTASAATATVKSNWIFVPKNQTGTPRPGDTANPNLRKTPIRYGEKIALAWVSEKESQVKWKFIKYGKRTAGINLKWSSEPIYEWAILGGKPGTVVKRGVDKVILYNLKHKQPMIHVKRNNGAGHIGWPDSKGATSFGSTKIIGKLTPSSVYEKLMIQPQDIKKDKEHNPQPVKKTFKQIKSMSGLCLDVEHDNPSGKNTNVQVSECNDSAEQLWVWDETGRIKNRVGLCIDIADTNGSITNGSNIELYQCNNSTLQKWESFSHNRIKSTNGGGCLAIDRRKGKNVRFNQCKIIDAQRWKF